MFVLKHHHERALNDAGFARYRARCVVQLRQFLPERTSGRSDDELEEFVALGCEHAREFGLVTERQMMRFLVACLLLEGLPEEGRIFTELEAILTAEEGAEERSRRLVPYAEWRCRGMAGKING